MCGITGWIDWEGDLRTRRPVLEAMTAALTPCGPDGAGFWFSRRAALGHRGPAAADPAGGGQPLAHRRDGRTTVITCDGELYNAPELRRELQDRGHTFRGGSDAEVLLAAYREWGPGCVERLRGIFAFAIWSEPEERLFAARDRLGVRPLFFAHRGSTFLFGSELKALLAHPAVRPEVDAGGLAEVLALGPARTPGHGVFRGVSELRPGCYLLADRAGVRTAAYWRLGSAPHPDDPDTTAATVRELLQDAVERQLAAGGPVCTMLSGGLDSTAVTALAAGVYRRRGLGPPPTWSVDYADNDRYFQGHDFQPNADGPWIRLVTGHLGTCHRQVVIDTPELVAALVPAMRARDLPGMADVDASLLLFCRAIRAEAAVALSGEGADEVFGGYPWFHRPELLSAQTFPWARHLELRERLLAPEVRERIRPAGYVEERYREALAEVPRLPGEDPEEARMRELFYLNLTRWLPVLLDRNDRMSRAAGLKVRVPFCDHRLVEYVWNVPWSVKAWDGREKGLLRRALAGVVPEEVRTRRKSPYPKTYHPAYLEAVRTRVLRLLDDPASPLRPLIDTAFVRELAGAAAAGSVTPWFGQLMAGPQLFAYLIQVDAWLREYRVTLC